jgi:hypothetical protein
LKRSFNQKILTWFIHANMIILEEIQTYGLEKDTA